MKKSAFHPFLVVIFAISCNTTYKAEDVQYSSYKIQQAAPSNAITSIIRPYSDSVNKLMNVVIGFNETQLERKKQGNTLGYFITDAYLEMAKQKIDANVDIAFMNTGGVRLPDLPAGPLTQGKMYELMPFDNQMVSLKIKGNILKEYLDVLAADDGVIESGMTLQIVNKTARQIMIGGKPLSPDAEYRIVHSDYVVMNTALLKNIDRKTNGYLLRDALIDYVKMTNSNGKKVKVLNTDRITYVN